LPRVEALVEVAISMAWSGEAGFEEPLEEAAALTATMSVPSAPALVAVGRKVALARSGRLDDARRADIAGGDQEPVVRLLREEARAILDR
jgi:hypothetical protein